MSFEPVSPCWAEFDIQTMRQGSTQGGRPPCNINSHLQSSCGYEHETLKETAAMDPAPSRHLSHGLPTAPFSLRGNTSRLTRRCHQHLDGATCF